MYDTTDAVGRGFAYELDHTKDHHNNDTDFAR